MMLSKDVSLVKDLELGEFIIDRVETLSEAELDMNLKTFTHVGDARTVEALK